jgi:hypothetical protein
VGAAEAAVMRPLRALAAEAAVMRPLRAGFCMAPAVAVARYASWRGMSGKYLLTNKYNLLTECSTSILNITLLLISKNHKLSADWRHNFIKKIVWTLNSRADCS